MNSREINTDEPQGDNIFESELAATRRGILAEHRWLIFILPLVVYMLLGNLEPKTSSVGVARHNSAETSPGLEGAETASEVAPRVDYRYPLTYTLRLAATIAAIVFVMPGYREFKFRVSGLGIAVGVVGILLWVGICQLNLETRLLVPLKLGWFIDQGERAAYDPFTQLGSRPLILVAFLAVRLIGLALIVPIIEEFFLRGFLMRFIAHPKWWALPLGSVTWSAIIAVTVYGALSHPAEMFAAVVWFSLVTWLMLKTQNIWDCVAAHATTNLLLGIYVLVYGQWHLW